MGNFFFSRPEQPRPFWRIAYQATPLINLVAQNNTPLILRFIRDHSDLCFPSHTDSEGNTALHLALINKNIPVALALINTFTDDCSILTTNKNGKTALDFISVHSFHPIFLAIFEKCQFTYDPSYISGEFAATQLINCISIPDKKSSRILTKKLIEKYQIRCLPGARDDQGNTALILACMYNDTETVLELLNWFGEECHPEFANEFGETALSFACYFNNTAIALELIQRFGEKCNSQQIDDAGDTAMSMACSYNNFTVIVKLAKLFAVVNEESEIAQSESDHTDSTFLLEENQKRMSPRENFLRRVRECDSKFPVQELTESGFLCIEEDSELEKT